MVGLLAEWAERGRRPEACAPVVVLVAALIAVRPGCFPGAGCFLRAGGVGLAGPGCLVHPWAAARPLAVRAASLEARRVGSEPGQAPPPPTGAAVWVSSVPGLAGSAC